MPPSLFSIFPRVGFTIHHAGSPSWRAIACAAPIPSGPPRRFLIQNPSCKRRYPWRLALCGFSMSDTRRGNSLYPAPISPCLPHSENPPPPTQEHKLEMLRRPARYKGVSLRMSASFLERTMEHWHLLMIDHIMSGLWWWRVVILHLVIAGSDHAIRLSSRSSERHGLACK